MPSQGESSDEALAASRIRTLEKRLGELEDREAIRDVLYKYCRAMDRGDVESLSTLFHSDSTDDHGEFKGSSQDFIKWAIVEGPRRSEVMHHSLGSINIELDGDVAYTESYFTNPNVARTPDGGEPMLFLLFGRYLDRFERRGGGWRIAARVVVRDHSEIRSFTEGDDQFQRAAWGSEDPVFQQTRSRG